MAIEVATMVLGWTTMKDPEAVSGWYAPIAQVTNRAATNTDLPIYHASTSIFASDAQFRMGFRSSGVWHSEFDVSHQFIDSYSIFNRMY